MPYFSVIKKADTEAAQISVCSDGIVRVMLKKKVDVTAKQFEKIFEKYNALIEGQSHPYIYYAEDGSSNVTEDGRAFAKKEEFSFPKVCNAVVVTRLSHKLLADFYFKINKPSFPFKVFTKMDDAEKWCLDQLERYKKQHLHIH